MHRDEDDFTGLIALEKLFSQTGAAFATGATQQLDVDSWLRTLAYESLVGPADAAYTGSNIHNFRLYMRPNDGRAMYLPWDWDSSFQRATNASLIGGGNLAKVVSSSADFTRRYIAHLYNIIQTSFNTNYMARWTQHYGSLAARIFQLSYLYWQSRNLVRSQLSTGTALLQPPGRSLPTAPLRSAGRPTSPSTTRRTARFTPRFGSNTAWTIVVPLGPGDKSDYSHHPGRSAVTGSFDDDGK
jgi:hypothetical protein